MTTAAKVSSAASLRYAAALLDLAQKKKNLAHVEKDLKDLLAMASGSRDLSVLIHSPLISKVQRGKAVMALADKAKFQPLTKNFLGVLINNGRLNILENIIAAFEDELARQRGEITVNVSVAQDMSAKQQKALQDALAKGMGAEVKLKTKVEPGILGGMVVTVGSHMIDDSVARKLERLQTAMSKQSNENPVNAKVKEA